MADLVWIVLIVLLVVLVLGLYSSMTRRSVAGGESVSTSGRFSTGLILGIIVLAALVILVLGLGTGQTNNPSITSPAHNNGGTSPPASPSPR